MTRYISPTNLTYLAGNELALCKCVKMTLRDGTVKGFTDHDQDLTISAVPYRAKVGLGVGAMRWTNRLDTEETELTGLFSALTGGLTEEEARLGLYNQAIVDIYLVKWTTPEIIVPLKRGVLSRITPEGAGYTAAVRSLADPLTRKPLQRILTKDCNADLGDAQCGISVSTYNGTTTTQELENFLTASAFAPPGDTTKLIGGKMVLTSGDLTWFVNKIKAYDAGTKTFTLVRPYPKRIDVGITFAAYEGCDKKASTCKDRFSNLVKFRGFPHVPDRDTTKFKIYPDEQNGGYLIGTGEDS